MRLRCFAGFNLFHCSVTCTWFTHPWAIYRLIYRVFEANVPPPSSTKVLFNILTCPSYQSYPKPFFPPFPSTFKKGWLVWKMLGEMCWPWPPSQVVYHRCFNLGSWLGFRDCCLVIARWFSWVPWAGSQMDVINAAVDVDGCFRGDFVWKAKILVEFLLKNTLLGGMREYKLR